MIGPDCTPHCGIKDGMEGHCPCGLCHGLEVEVTQMGDTIPRYVKIELPQ